MTNQTKTAEPSLHERLMTIINSPEAKAEALARRRIQEVCTHEGWSFKKHGRCCFKCGTFMVDFGD